MSKKEFNLLGCKRDAMPQNATSAGPSTWKKGRVMHEHDSLRQSSWIPLRCAHEDVGTLATQEKETLAEIKTQLELGAVDGLW